MVGGRRERRKGQIKEIKMERRERCMGYGQIGRRKKDRENRWMDDRWREMRWKERRDRRMGGQRDKRERWMEGRKEGGNE